MRRNVPHRHRPRQQLALRHHNVLRHRLVVPFRRRHVRCHLLVGQFHHRPVVVVVVLALVAKVVLALVLVCVLALVVRVPAALVSVLVCVLALAVRVLAALVVLADSALVVLALVLVLVLALVVQVVAVRVQVVVQEAPVLAVVQVVLQEVAAQEVAVRVRMVNAVHRERSRVHDAVVSLRNCSRSSLHTRRRMLRYQKARSSLNVAHLHKSSHRN